MKTLIIDNFGGRLTRYNYGDINSGFAKYANTANVEPFFNLNNLSWQETPTQIDAAGSVITDLIVAGKQRVESGIAYVYCIGHTGRLYKIQVNDPNNSNPNYDNPVLLTTLTAQSPTFTRGGFIDFFGSTERIFIGHDKGVTRVNFDGTSETFVGAAGSYTTNVPRPLRQFLGKLYFGNGSNLGEIDSTATVTTYSKFSPGFPDNTQVRDLDISADGVYLHAVVSRLALNDITATTPDTNIIANSESFIFKWNGTDNGYTTYNSFPSFSLNANQIYGDFQFTFGYDTAGAALFDPVNKVVSPIYAQAPLPNAIASSNNLIAWGVPEYDTATNRLRVSVFLYGVNDSEVPLGWWRLFAAAAQGDETDVIRVPFGMLVSNLVYAASSSGYAGNVVGFGKVYFSTLETSAAPTTKYKLYKAFITPTTVGTAATGVYETQTQLFSRKVLIKEVRVYGKPWVANNSFTIDLIGSNGTAITNGSKTFTAGSSLTVGDDFAWYNPGIEPTFALGLRLTNAGSANHTILKVEIDYDELGGK